MKYWQPDYSIDDADLISRSAGGSGTATTLPTDAEDDTVKRLHAVIEEITGKPVLQKEKPRIGFL
jgi:hypothetical protein